MRISMRYLSAAVLLAAMLCAGGPAWAQMGPGMMYGGGWGGRGASALTADQQAAAQKIYTQHYQATEKTRQQLYAKTSELNALLYGQKTDDKRIQTLSKEVSDLRGKLFEDGVQMRRQLIKAGVPVMGMGMGGGRGMGWGMMMDGDD